MTEILFYHLQRSPLERTLPRILEKCLERGWRVAVQVEVPERLAALDDALWTYADESFLPHGTAGEGDPAEHPVHLAGGPENVNSADVRVMVDGAAPPDLSGYSRAFLMFDGNDPEAVDKARAQWRALKALGHDLTYWQQDEGGRWERKG
jgi:DNA polymerase-3 subunit chi